MVDVHSPSVRRRNMKAIRSKDTKAELKIRKLLRMAGFGYRKHFKALPGTPDVYLSKYNAAIFVNGCFFHGHQCHLFKIPETNKEKWMNKIESNKLRDSNNLYSLKKAGVRVLIVWECSLKGKYKISDGVLINKIRVWLNSDLDYFEIGGSIYN